MTAFFSTAFIAALSASPGIVNGSVVKMVPFRQAPNFAADDSRYTGKTTVAQLLAMPGWIPVTAGGPPLANTITVGVRDEGKSNYVVFSSYPFTGLARSEVQAVAFLRPDNTIMFVTNTPFGGEVRVVADGDAVTAAPDSTLGAVSNRWLFSWADAPQAGGTIVTISEGPLLLSLGPPPFEPSHTQHVWLYPQRANMIANPSFELPSPPTGYWTTNGSASRVALVNPPIAAGRFAGRFQYGGIVVAESNIFPTMREERWTIQLMIRGVGNCKVGFVWWDDDFDEAVVDWGDETWQLDPNTFVHISVCRTPVQTYQGMLRIECDGGDMTIDQVLCERGYLKDWPYFDGDTDFGMREDFTWYGGEVRQGASYSLWYNHKKAVYGRMFARQIDGTTLITDEVMRAQGVVYEWVPAGTVVVPHMDVLYPNDLQLVVPDKVGVLSYRFDPIADFQGIINPWGLVASAGMHAHSVDHVTIQPSLIMQSATHASAADGPTIFAVPNTPIVPADSTIASTSANLALFQNYYEYGDPGVHAITSANVTLGLQTGAPLPVRSGLLLWYDADDPATIDYNFSNLVWRWYDKSAYLGQQSGRWLLQTTSTYDPARGGSQNGHPFLTFDGVDDIMSTGTFAQAQPMTIFIALNPVVDTGITQGWFSSVGGNFQIGTSGGQVGMYCGTANLASGGLPTPNQPQVWIFIANGASSSLQCQLYNGNVAITGANPGTSGTTTGVRVAERTGAAANLFAGAMYEICVYNRVLNPGEITQVQGYLNTKWDIPPTR